MLTCSKKDFAGRLSCSYDRPYRLIGCWEVRLVSVTPTSMPVYIMCDLVDYTEVNQSKQQLLDYIYASKTIKCINHRSPYVRLLHKRFNTINIDIKPKLESHAEAASRDYTNVFLKEEGLLEEEITCLLHFRRIG